MPCRYIQATYQVHESHRLKKIFMIDLSLTDTASTLEHTKKAIDACCRTALFKPNI